MSLLEILISIFIILFGMLGVAALLPVGRYEMSMCLRADRAGNAGRAALREAQVRGMLDPATWISAQPFSWDVPVAIDPLGYGPANGWFPVPQGSNPICMPRVTLAAAPTLPLVPMSPLLADRIFTWQDDLIFNYPDEKTLRPRQQLHNLDGSMSTILSPLAATADRSSMYSWMMTVAPADNEFGLDGNTRKLYTLSAVVFFSRLLTPEGELTCDVAAPGPLVGGGDVVLGGPNGANAVQVRPGEWILLRGANSTTGRYAFKWYRVIAADFNSQTNTCRVTLAGPDWMDISTYTIQAGIFPGAIGVYTETIELER